MERQDRIDQMPPLQLVRRLPRLLHPTLTMPAAAAAKINADLQARKGIQHVDVPSIRSVSLGNYPYEACEGLTFA